MKKRGIAIVAALIAGAAPASASAEASICDPLSASSLLAGASGMPTGIAGRGGDVREPDLGAGPHRSAGGGEGPSAEELQGDGPGVLPRDHRGGGSARSPTRRSRAQIDVLNATFAGGEGGANTGFGFKLAGVTRTDNAAWFYAARAATTRTR